MTYLHFGGASTASVVVAVVTIFFLMFAMSFAVGPVPHGQKRFSRAWTSAWFKASLPRMIAAGTFAGALFVASSLSGGGNGGSAQNASVICRQPVPALSAVPVTPARIATAAESMREIAAAAEAGDYRLAQAMFFGETHNLTHDIDGPLREADADLAIGLCENVLTLETQLPTGMNLGLIQTAAESSARQLDRARELLSEAQ